MLKIDQKNVDKTMNHHYKQLGDQAKNIFKTITSDNGSEFVGIYKMLMDTTDVFFAHPLVSEFHNTDAMPLEYNIWSP